MAAAGSGGGHPKVQESRSLGEFQGFARTRPVLYLLAHVRRDARTALAAIDHLRPGTILADDHAKLRALALPDLAGSHLLAGDLDSALDVGHRAVDAATQMSSAMVTAQLRTFDTVLANTPATSDVTELRRRLTHTAA